MTTTWAPRPDQRTHCANCGAARPAHDYVTRACPVAYRPSTLEAAVADLSTATAGRDPSRLFIARGEVQRLLDHRPGTCLPMCDACGALLVAGRGEMQPA